MQNFWLEFPIIDIDDKYILRAQSENDLENFYHYFSDPDVSKYILSSIPNNLVEAIDEIKYWIDLYHRRTGIYWAIAEKSTNKMIGAIGFHEWNKFNNRVEISYDLAKEYWGQGIMSKAMKKIMAFAFNEMKINRIQASTILLNKPSINLLRANNFQYDGRLRHFRFHNGKYYDIEMYSLLASDYFTPEPEKKLSFFDKIKQKLKFF